MTRPLHPPAPPSPAAIHTHAVNPRAGKAGSSFDSRARSPKRRAKKRRRG